MNEALKPTILILSLVLILFPSSLRALTLTTASPEGAYFSTGNAIVELVGNKVQLEVISSNGSIDNLVKLSMDKASLAIIQADILYKAMNSQKGERLFKYQETAIKLRNIVALFPEYIQVLVRKDSAIKSIFKLNNQSIYIGKNNSGTFENATEILNYFRINESNNKEGGGYKRVMSDSSPKEAIEALLDKSNPIAAVFLTSGVINDNKELRVLSLRKSLSKQISSDKKYYSYKEITDADGEARTVLFTRALLVTKSQEDSGGLSVKDAQIITKTIYENQFQLEAKIRQNISFFIKDSMVRKVAHNLHLGSENFFKGNDVLPGYTWKPTAFFILFSYFFILIIVTQFGMSWRSTKAFANLNVIQKLYRNKLINWAWKQSITLSTGSSWRIIVCISAWVLLFTILAITFLEKSFSMEYDVENPFAGSSFMDVLQWLLTFAVTGFNQDLFPQHPFAKVLAILIPILMVLGAFLVVIRKTIQSNHNEEKELRGVLVPKLTGHIVICGWNDRAPNLIRELTSDYASGFHVQVAIVAEIDEDKPLEKYNFKKGMVFYCRGISSDLNKLNEVSITQSKCAIVLAGDKKIKNNNIRSILTTEAIQSICNKNNRNDYSIIAELFYPRNKKYFEHNKTKKLVSLDKIASRMVTHATLNPGISDLLLSLLSFRPPHHAFIFDTNNKCEQSLEPQAVVSKRFKEALFELREQGFLLLAIIKKDHSTISNTVELDFNQAGDSPYITATDQEDGESYTIKKGDKLLLIKTITIKKDSIKNKKFISSQYLPFISRSEQLIIIADENEASEVIHAALPHFNKIIHLIPKQNSGESLQPSHTADNNIIRLEFRRLDEVFAENNNEVLLSKTTKAIVMASSRNNNAGDHSIYQDDGTMMYCKDLRLCYESNSANEPLHIIAEIRNEDNLELFHQVGVSQPVPTNRLIELILSQMAFHGGLVSEFFLKSMSYSDENAKTRMVKWSAQQLNQRLQAESSEKVNILGNTYDEILQKCVEKNIQLLAIEKENHIILNPEKSSNIAAEGLGENDYVYIFIRP